MLNGFFSLFEFFAFLPPFLRKRIRVQTRKAMVVLNLFLDMLPIRTGPQNSSFLWLPILPFSLAIP